MVTAVDARWMLYGANGYTGQLVAKLAVTRGERPLLAARDAAAVGRLAAGLGLDHRAVALTDAAGLRAALAGVGAVAHCAGPFTATSAPMVEACLATGTHYLDITGEVPVFEAVLGRHEDAVAAGVVLLPGAGFDVVPTDCLAGLLAAALPDADTLELGYVAGGGSSGGTASTGLDVAARGGLRRVEGRLVPSPFGRPRRAVPFASGTRMLGAMTWGDLVTAYRSTGIGNITMYGPVPVRESLAGAAFTALQWAMRLGPARALATRVVRRRVSGPDEATRAATTCEVWAQVRNAAGQSRSATLTGPNGYDLTADAVVRAVRYVLAGTGPAGPIAPGAHTPATALGPEFVRELDGVTVTQPAE
jgi:saccharopine dehydrogenase (NAD+, L-lysine-forming)